MLRENDWKAVRVDALPDGSRTKLISAVDGAVRLYCEQHWSRADHEGVRTLLAERFYTTDPDRAHRTAEAAMAAAMQPVENNEP
jgi:hypothetical protein